MADLMLRKERQYKYEPLTAISYYNGKGVESEERVCELISEFSSTMENQAPLRQPSKGRSAPKAGSEERYVQRVVENVSAIYNVIHDGMDDTKN